MLAANGFGPSHGKQDGHLRPKNPLTGRKDLDLSLGSYECVRWGTARGQLKTESGLKMKRQERRNKEKRKVDDTGKNNGNGEC